MVVEPIGWVHAERAEPDDDDWDAVPATITLDPGAVGPTALAGLDAWSHVEVVYALHHVEPGAVETGARRPRGNPDWPQVGILAQRAKRRPNRLGVTVCRLLDVDGLTVTVAGLDAVDGTPVLDLKPWMAELGPRGAVRQPAWSHEVMAGYWDRASLGRPSEVADTRSGYDAVAEPYDQQIGGELAAKPLDRALLAVLAEEAAGRTVADLGGGPGHVAAHLRQLGVPTVTVDVSAAMAGRARGRAVPAAVGDVRSLPLAAAGLGGVVCAYALLHLGVPERAAAYREMARVLQPGAPALVAFHTGDADAAPGSARRLASFHGRDVDLTFRFLVPDVEASLAAAAGLDEVARVERAPVGGAEHPSRRCTLILRRR